MSLFVFFISLLIVAQHVSGNHVPIIRSWRLRDVIALCWYVPWLQEGCQVRLVGSASMVFPIHTELRCTVNHTSDLSWSWAACWPVPVSRIQKPFQTSTMIPSARWGVVFIRRIYMEIPTAISLKTFHMSRKLICDWGSHGVKYRL